MVVGFMTPDSALTRCELYGTMNRDSPIDLHCMTRYCLDDISVWDVIGEVVLLTTEAPPANPFHVDHTYLDNLPLQQQVFSQHLVNT